MSSALPLGSVVWSEVVFVVAWFGPVVSSWFGPVVSSWSGCVVSSVSMYGLVNIMGINTVFILYCIGSVVWSEAVFVVAWSGRVVSSVSMCGRVGVFAGLLVEVVAWSL